MKIYLCDGTLDSFYAAVFSAYRDGEAHLVCDDIQIGINDDIMPVNNNENHAARVRDKLYLYDPRSEWEIKNILKSNLPDRAQRAYLYVRRIMQYRRPVRGMLSDEVVLNATDVVRKVLFEAERLRGFLRFTECENGILYAPCSPDNDIVEDLFPHFKRRFPAEKFIIHDVKRKKAVLYNGKSAVTVPLDRADVLLSEKEEAFCRLWKEYYRAVNIAARKNVKQQDSYMPRRYRKFLSETY